MAATILAQLEHDVRAAGYRLLSSEQLRANRWLLTAHTPSGQSIAILVQARALIGESDVQDLAEFVRVRRLGQGILLAKDGKASPHALRALRELGAGHLQICTNLPTALPDPVITQRSTVTAPSASS